ncbi:hypothetical protein [Acaryochloris sp. CCMEE 5410]|uniref:hypothetical protein n=1 Tax=Acaryochloris sp. CCMEE 5410 TaxID=310037 RepID=UPI0037BE2A66
MSLLILFQVLVMLSPSHVWGMEKQEKRESITHQDSRSKQTYQQKTSAKSGQVKQDKDTPISSTIEAMFNSILEIFKQHQEPPLVSRGNLCTISPGILGKTNIIWSNQPLFLWRGEVTKLLVRDYETDEVLWQNSGLEDRDHLVYNGKPLIPGKAYIWEATNTNTTIRYEFKVMKPKERQQVIYELEKMSSLENLKKPNLSNLFRKIQYLGERGLISDVLQVLYAYNFSNVDINEQRKKLSKIFC